MAGSAGVHELLLAVDDADLIVGQARQRPNVLGDVASRLGVDRALERRHDAVATIGDGCQDGFGRTTVDRIAFGQVGEARGALRI